MRLILASASPRRRELLAAAGYAFDVAPIDLDETQQANEPAVAYVERLAREKALAGAARHPGRVVLGADTTVVVDGDILGKPEDAADATRMIRRLGGRSHQVLTGVAVACDTAVRSRVAETVVWMTAWPDGELAEYVATREPYDKAGAYAIQGAASRFVVRIEGERDTVIGLPVRTVVALLADWPGVLRQQDVAPYPER